MSRCSHTLCLFAPGIMKSYCSDAPRVCGVFCFFGIAGPFVVHTVVIHMSSSVKKTYIYITLIGVHELHG